MVAMVNAGHFIDGEFPARFRALIPAALKAAYAAVDDLYKTEVILQVRKRTCGPLGGRSPDRTAAKDAQTSVRLSVGFI
jgi:hypothetical protein